MPYPYGNFIYDLAAANLNVGEDLAGIATFHGGQYTQDLRIALCSSGYIPNKATHLYFLQIGAANIIATTAELTGRTYSGGVFNASSISSPPLPITAPITSIVIWRKSHDILPIDTLVAYIDTGVSGLPITSDGLSQIKVDWDPNGIFVTLSGAGNWMPGQAFVDGPSDWNASDWDGTNQYTVYGGAVGLNQVLFPNPIVAMAPKIVLGEDAPVATGYDMELSRMERVQADLFHKRPGAGGNHPAAVGVSGLGSHRRKPYCPPEDTVRQDQRRNFFERGSIVTPAPGEVVALSFRVPDGYFGLALGYYCVYTGTGFDPGSGDIAWRLKVGSRYVTDMGNMLYSAGSVTNPLPFPSSEHLASGDVVQILVNIANGTGNIQVGASRILCGLQGWLYPMAQPVPWRGGMRVDQVGVGV